MLARTPLSVSSLRGFGQTASRLAAPKSKKELEAKKTAEKRADRRSAQLKADARKAASTDRKFMSIPQALQYLRAAEVGRGVSEAKITVQTRVFKERGVAPLAGAIRLPRPLKQIRILCITNDADQKAKALEAGAAEVVAESAIDDIVQGKFALDFDKVLATPEVEISLRKAARVLGPKGLMPSAKKGTVAADLSAIIAGSMGTQPFKEKNDNVSLTIARCDFSDAEIVKNILATSEAIKQSVATTKSKKPIILGHTHLSSTHGPSIVINF